MIPGTRGNPKQAALLSGLPSAWFDRKLNSGLRHRNSVDSVSMYVAFHLRMIAIKRKRSIKLGKSNRISVAANLKRADPYKMYTGSNNVLELNAVVRYGEERPYICMI